MAARFKPGGRRLNGGRVVAGKCKAGTRGAAGTTKALIKGYLLAARCAEGATLYSLLEYSRVE